VDVEEIEEVINEEVLVDVEETEVVALALVVDHVLVEETEVVALVLVVVMTEVFLCTV
jgi:hypothetical protein